MFLANALATLVVWGPPLPTDAVVLAGRDVVSRAGTAGLLAAAGGTSSTGSNRRSPAR